MRKHKPQTIKDLAHAYSERARKRFKKQHGCGDEHCDFCAGWTWGAVDGYLAAMRAAKKLYPKRRTSRT